MKFLSAFFIAIFLITGCEKQDVLSHAPAESHVISGQVFVVTQGRDNIKLALVAVGAIPRGEFDQYLKTKQSKKLEQQQLLLPKYIEAKKHLLLLKESYKATNNFMNTRIRIQLHNEAENPSEEFEKSIDRDKANLDKTKTEINKIKAEMAEYELFDKVEFLFEGQPHPSTIAKTDADGKFSLTLPKGKYVITANSSRSVGSHSETYYWLVSVDAASPNQSLMLSNDNLFETKCNECVKF